MQAKPKQIIEPQALTATTDEYYAAPAGKKVIISKFTLSNGGAAAVACDVHIVPSGDSADATNKIIPAKLVDTDEAFAAYQLEGQVLDEGDKIFVKGGADVVVMSSGVELF